MPCSIVFLACPPESEVEWTLSCSCWTLKAASHHRRSQKFWAGASQDLQAIAQRNSRFVLCQEFLLLLHEEDRAYAEGFGRPDSISIYQISTESSRAA
jgi:hypothetical protein